MARKIVAVGHGDTSERGFGDDSKFVEYIRSGVVERQGGRYRLSKRIEAVVVVLSRKGTAFGHFKIAGIDEPNAKDQEDYPKVQRVLLVSRAILYDQSFNLNNELGIRVSQAPKTLTEDDFERIQRAGHGGRVFGDAANPEGMSVGVYLEGQRKDVAVSIWERNREAVKECKRLRGTRCEVCEQDLGTIYGDIGDGYIHVHHLVPGSEGKIEHAIDPGRDLCPVCPNCHAMIHRHRPPFTIEQMRRRLADGAGKSKSAVPASPA